MHVTMVLQVVLSTNMTVLYELINVFEHSSPKKSLLINKYVLCLHVLVDYRC